MVKNNLVQQQSTRKLDSSSLLWSSVKVKIQVNMPHVEGQQVDTYEHLHQHIAAASADLGIVWLVPAEGGAGEGVHQAVGGGLPLLDTHGGPHLVRKPSYTSLLFLNYLLTLTNSLKKFSIFERE